MTNPTLKQRRLLFVLATAVILAGAMSTAVADDLDALLAQYKSWRGGDAYARLQTLRVDGTLEAVGLTGKSEYLSSAKGEVYQNIDLGVFRQTQVVDAASGWVTTQSGQIESLPDDAIRDARREALLDFPALLQRSGMAKLSLLPDESRDGETWRVIHLDFGDQDDVDLFVDPATGAQHGYRKKQNNQTTFVRQTDWRLVDGVRMPFVVETIEPNAAENTRLVVAHASINQPPPDHWLSRPAAVRKVSFAHDARRTAWTPIDFKTHRAISFPGTINGVATQIILDSGAAMTVLDTEFAARAGIKPQGTVAATGTTGTETVSFAKGVHIHIGEMDISDVTVAVMPLAKLTAAYGDELTVILGKELLNEVVLDIDFDNQRIAMENADHYQPPPGSIAVPLNLNKDALRTVDVRIEGGPAVPALFDLGSNSSLAINASYWEPHQLARNHRSSVVGVGGVGGGKVVASEIVAGSLTIGPFEFSNVPAELSPRGPTAAESDRTLANVGAEVWSRFRVITNYAENRLYLLPTASAFRKPFNKDRSGLALAPASGGLAVFAVAGGSSAARQGWHVGDTILKVDGASAVANQSDDWRWRSAGTVVLLSGTNSNGKPFERRLVLEDFY